MMHKALAFIFATIFATVVSAQTPSGGINGTVSGPSGGVVASAEVKAINDDTNSEATVTTAGDGRFSFQGLSAGSYTVTVTASGFADGEADNVEVTDGNISTVSLKLDAAEGAEPANGGQEANPAPAQQPQGTEQPAAAGMIDLGSPPLAPEEMNSVMTWIAAQVSAINLPYCYRQSYGNGAGEPYACRDGFDRNGLLCYPKCREGFAGNGPVCWGVCPEGSNDIGAFCQKGFGRKDASGACGPGFRVVGFRGGTGCMQVCPDGWNDTGSGCTKPSYGRGAGEPLAMGTCAPGLQKDPAGALCYPTCKADFHMVGPVCWQNCPSQQSFECGVGCSTTQKECVKGTFDMVLAPIELAASLIPYAGEIGGAAHGATAGAEAAAHAAELGADASRIAKAAAKLKDAYGEVKGSLKAVEGKIVDAVGGEDNMAKLMAVKKVGGKVYVAGNNTNKQMDLYSREYADNFDKLTSPEIAAQIDQRFGQVGAYQVKREWGVRHLLLALNSDGFATAVNQIGTLSAADFTGVLSVVSAYMKPVCANNTVFPAVSPLYSD